MPNDKQESWFCPLVSHCDALHTNISPEAHFKTVAAQPLQSLPGRLHTASQQILVTIPGRHQRSRCAQLTASTWQISAADGWCYACSLFGQQHLALCRQQDGNQRGQGHVLCWLLSLLHASHQKVLTLDSHVAHLHKTSIVVQMAQLFTLMRDCIQMYMVMTGLMMAFTLFFTRYENSPPMLAFACSYDCCMLFTFT